VGNVKTLSTLQLFARASNLANFMRMLVLPKEIKHWFLTTLREKVVSFVAKVVKNSRYVTLQMTEVVISGSAEWSCAEF